MIETKQRLVILKRMCASDWMFKRNNTDGDQYSVEPSRHKCTRKDAVIEMEKGKPFYKCAYHLIDKSNILID